MYEAAKLKEVEKQTVQECLSVEPCVVTAMLSPTSKEADAAAENIS